MKSIIKILGKYKKETVLAPLFKLLEASFELLVPLVVASLIDYGILQSDKGHIIKSFLLLILLAVVGLISSVTAQYFSAKAAIGVSTQLRSDMFARIQSFSFSELDKLGTSTMITRMTSDINQVQNGVNMFLRLFLRSPFIVFGAMIMAFTVDVKGALVF
ncbi:MAG: ABC transporter ATP-binding protein, partial [Clostridia bacterium]|nr:ABC transporter ATP-binding protein [Clostridia bacterium]